MFSTAVLGGGPGIKHIHGSSSLIRIIIQGKKKLKVLANRGSKASFLMVAAFPKLSLGARVAEISEAP